MMHQANRMLTRTLLTLLVTGACAGCGADSEPNQSHWEVTRTSLSPLMGLDANPTGIAVDSESGQRYILDKTMGIFEILPNGEFVSLWTPDAELPALTDLCAVGGGRFVAAADGDGYIIGTTEVLVDTTVYDILDSAGTAPEDYTEGLDAGETLNPQSLYEDQLTRRLARGDGRW